MKSIKDIISNFSYKEFIGDENTMIRDLIPLNIANNRNDVLFWCNDLNLQKLSAISNGCIICSEKIYEIGFNPGCQYIIVEHPKLFYLRIMKMWKVENEKYGIHPTAIIHPEAIFSEEVYIGPYCIIGKCKIANQVHIQAHTVIHDNVTIGNRVRIHDHANIGSAGFGFVRNENGKLEKMPDLGSVLIGDDVELFPYVNIDLGTLSVTKVGRGTKIDRYVHIAHNCQIGEDCVITAQVVFCGGSSIGNSSWVGIGSIIKEKVVLGQNVIIGLGAVVTKNIPDNATWIGSPARPLTEFKLISDYLKKQLITQSK